MSAGQQLRAGTQYRKKPVAVEAWEITPQLFDVAFAQHLPQLQGVTFHVDQSGHYVTLHSELTERSRGELGDWIVRTAAGKLGLYAREDFAAKYDAVPPTLTVEQEIQAKGLNAPRVTPASIEAAIAAEYCFSAADATKHSPQLPELGLLTICVLILRNGFTVIGKSACASPENFDAALGRRIAREDAVRQIWPLEGYLLKQRLFMGPHLPEQLDTDNRTVEIERIARGCHEISRAYCEAIGDHSQVSWELAPHSVRASCIEGVKFALANPAAGAEQLHAAWLESKAREGWVWGPVKDPELKQHPCMVPYEQLPAGQQAKDYLFRATVQQFAGQ